MPRAYSLDLRERVLRALDAGRSAPEIEQLFGITQRTVFRWQAQRRAGRPLTPRTSTGRTPKIGLAQHDALRAQVAAHPDATLAQHVALWQAATGVRVGIATMARTLTALDITRKKVRTAAERDEQARAAWREATQQWDAVDLVFR